MASETEAPPFFVPNARPGMDEEAYTNLAGLAGASAAAPGRRIYSVTFEHNLETWIATVGQQLRGTRWKTHRVRGEKVERQLQLGDRSTVMAIFASHPYLVWHDNASHHWENPFLVGEPRSIIYFPA